MKNLVAEGLKEEAQRWESSAQYALRFPVAIKLPYAERRILDADQSSRAIAFSAPLALDQQISIKVNPSQNSRVPVFVDVFEKEDTDQEFKRLVSKENYQQELIFDAPKTGIYIFRIQAGYQAKGLVDLVISSKPKYIFPVQNTHANSVQSFFGVPRDAGKRKHKGVDIFAARGTPVLSVSEGRVYKTANTPVGGNNVWVRQGNYSFYYAHLHEINVEQGQTIKIGQQLGTVGNTGNAKTTKPHLHFGIYKGWNGAIDPFPLINDSHLLIEKNITTTQLVPKWMAVSSSTLNLREGPMLSTQVLQKLKREELIQVEAISGNWLRVTTAEGYHGYVARRLVRQPKADVWRADVPYTVVSEPYAQAPVLSKIEAGESLKSLGEFGAYRLIQLAEGLTAWASPTADLTSSQVVNDSEDS